MKLRSARVVALLLGAAIIVAVPASAALAAGTSGPPSAGIVARTAKALAPQYPTTQHTTTPRAAGDHAATKHTTAPHDASDHVVNISTNCNLFCFVPEQLTITVGDTVTWTNKTPAEHIVARCDPARCNGVAGGTGADAGFASANLTMNAGGNSHFTFTAPGTYVYFCTIHGYALMHGTITVTAAAPTTTAATAITTAPTSPTAAAATASAFPQLANTGNGTNGSVVIALILIGLGLGLTATSFQLRRWTS